MKFLKALILSCLVAFSAHGQISHSIWNELLNKHVSSTGLVSYKGFLKDSAQLNTYLDQLSRNVPSEKWTDKDKLAYWINAYNAFTVKLIIDNYPVTSIKDIKKGIPFVNSVWDIKFITIGDEKMSLNEIEHSILRKEFDEPRIHFAIVCASRSCPKLLNAAYSVDKLEQQLEQQTFDFVNDESKNKFSKKEIQISQIFSWFKGDFTKGQTVQTYLAQFSKTPFDSNAKVKHLDYDWNLNGK